MTPRGGTAVTDIADTTIADAAREFRAHRRNLLLHSVEATMMHAMRAVSFRPAVRLISRTPIAMLAVKKMPIRVSEGRRIFRSRMVRRSCLL